MFASPSGQQQMTMNYAISQQNWTHLAIQAYLASEVANNMKRKLFLSQFLYIMSVLFHLVM